MNTPAPLPPGYLPTAQELDTALRAALAPEVLEVLDESGAHAGHAGGHPSGRGTHFRVRIGGASLQGKPRVAQHRLVYDALRPFLDAGLHALAIELVATQHLSPEAASSQQAGSGV